MNNQNRMHDQLAEPDCFGIVPFEFKNKDDFDKLGQGDVIRIEGRRSAIKNREVLNATVIGKQMEIPLILNISDRQIELILKGVAINDVKDKKNLS